MFIERFYPVKGGAELQAQSLAKELIKKGVDVTVLTKRFNHSKKGEIVDGIKIKRINAPKKGKIGTILFILKSLFFIKTHRFDILHMHGVNLFSGILAKIAKPKPSIVKTTTAGDVRAIKKFGGFWLNTLKNIDYFICTSMEQEKEVKKEIKGIKTILLSNGVDTDKFKPGNKKKLRKKLKIPNKIVFAFSGRLVKRKGLIFLVNVWKDLVKENKELCLVLLGSGKLQPDSCEEELINFIKENNLEHNIIMKGEVNNTNEYLQASDFFIFPSEKEGLPNAILEAMATGLPVIASKIGGNIDLIEHYKTGILYKLNDEKEIKNVIRGILNNKELQYVLGKNARKKVIEQYSIKYVADKYINLYKKMIKK